MELYQPYARAIVNPFEPHWAELLDYVVIQFAYCSNHLRRQDSRRSCANHKSVAASIDTFNNHITISCAYSCTRIDRFDPFLSENRCENCSFGIFMR